MIVIREPRKFISETLNIETFETLSPYYNDLINREINSLESFTKWLKDKSELDAFIEEDAAWRYIKMTIDTTNETDAKGYAFFISEILPKLAPLDDALNKIQNKNKFKDTLINEEAFRIYFKTNDVLVHLFREENIPLETELNELAQKYGVISAAQTVLVDGEEKTMQQAAQYLKKLDESIRKDTFIKMVERRRMDVEQLDQLFSDLILKRHQVAQNAGCAEFRDYKFLALGRFDYTKEDCFNFHHAIKTLIVPLVRDIQAKKLVLLGKARFQPWDLEVDPEGKEALQPFKTGKEMLDGTKTIFNKIDPYFSACLQTMEEMGHLDLESKTGKAPGGYNYPLYEIGVPFIFMNAVGAQRDLVTMIHEGGHAVHSFLSRELSLTGFKNLPSEVAELASMSMELLSMSFWEEFYPNPDDLKRAKREQLEGVLKVLPWIAQIDAFQHWVYENVNHSIAERHAYWAKLSTEYGTGLTDWSGYEDQINTSWQRQLHLFEVPFYYIEYGIAQLGALGIWKNSKENFAKTIQDYKAALALGYTKSIPDIYQTAGIQFDFSTNHLASLINFIKSELNNL
jgi:oligoendopeptidase F